MMVARGYHRTHRLCQDPGLRTKGAKVRAWYSPLQRADLREEMDRFGLDGARRSGVSMAQNQSDGLAGTWRLVSASAVTEGGGRNDSPFGTNPSGVLTYTPGGRMTVLIANGGKKALSGDRISAPAEERAQAFATFLAYSGRYSLKGDKVIHHVEISSVENWVRTDLVRTVTFEAERITLTTPPVSVGGRMQTTELVSERVK